MHLQVCDMCEDPVRSLFGECKLCRADICDDSECAAYLRKYDGRVCVACHEDLPTSDFTEAEKKELNITE